MSIIDKITGRAKKAAGDLADDPSLRREGRNEERKGDAKESQVAPRSAPPRSASASPTSSARPDANHGIVLTGRRAIVTGAATGIGRATALRLGADGAAVAVNYIGDRAPADEVVAQIGGPGPWRRDVSSESGRRALREAEEALGGPVDLLVNNAGVEAPYELADMPLAGVAARAGREPHRPLPLLPRAGAPAARRAAARR